MEVATPQGTVNLCREQEPEEGEDMLYGALGIFQFDLGPGLP